MRSPSAQLGLAATALAAAFAAHPANAAALDARCITVKDVVIVSGAEAWADKKLCKSPGSARYDVIEVAQAVYGAASTQAAFEKASNPQLRELRGQIEALRAQVAKAGDEAADARLALISAQGRFIAALAGKDRSYAEAIGQFRNSVVDIAATPEGTAALAQYNAGDEVGALAILDKLRAANDEARQTQSNIASAAEGRRIANLALDARNKGKLTMATVIARYEDVTRLDPGVFQDWIDLNELYQDAGRLSDAGNAVKFALATARSAFDHAISLVDLGDILIKQGDLLGADGAYSESLSSFRKLTNTAPDDFRILYNLSISLERIGSLHKAQGDVARADVAYAESLAVRLKLAARDPSNALAQRFVSAIIGLIGNLRMAQGNLQAADAAYVESLSMSRNLANADPNNPVAQIDVSIGLERIGSVCKMRGDLTGASTAYGESLAIARKLAAADPSNVFPQVAIFTSLEQIGELQFSQRNLAEAEKSHAEAFTIARRLSLAEPGNEDAQRRVMFSLDKTGDLRKARGDFAAANQAYAECLTIRRKLASAHPRDTVAQRGILGTLYKLMKMTGSGVQWHDIVVQLETMQTLGILDARGKVWLASARANAARDKGK